MNRKSTRPSATAIVALVSFWLVLAPAPVLASGPTSIDMSPVDSSPVDTTTGVTADGTNESEWLGKTLSLGSVGLVFVTGALWAQFAWYDDPPNDSFEWNDDGWFGRNTYAGGSDKLGHFWSNMFFVRATAGLLDLGGWDRSVSTAIATGVTTAAFLLVEIKDAYYFAFSVSDLISNVAGAALGVAFRHSPALDDALDLRVLYWPSDEFRGEGSVNFAEDYSGQTYLLAGHLSALPLGDSWVTRPLRYTDVVLGFGARNYKPDLPADSQEEPFQELFLGVSINFQTVVDDIFFDGGASGGKARDFARFGFEHIAIPKTTGRLVTADRE